MKKILVVLSVLVSVGFSISAYGWTTTQDAASRLGAVQVREITFDKNSSNLSDSLKKDIKEVINEASQKGKIVEVKILAWSDKEYPTENGKQTKQEVGLAKNRLKTLKKFLKDELKVSNVETHNMTERPNALQKLLNTNDAKVKTAAESTGAAPTDGNTGLFEMKAQASKASIMVFMKK